MYPSAHSIFFAVLFVFSISTKVGAERGKVLYNKLGEDKNVAKGEDSIVAGGADNKALANMGTISGGTVRIE